jgi:predicted secreted protein with PEFG-CTERM motif
MNNYALSVLIAIMAAAGMLAIVPAYASFIDQQPCPDCGSDDIYYKAELIKKASLPVQVMTDKKVYDYGSEIRVFGSVANLRADSPVTITVYGPQNNLVTVRQVEIASDNTFETAFITSGPLFKQDGKYTIRAQYGPQQINDKVVIEMVGGPGITTPTTVCKTNELMVKAIQGGNVYCLPYEVFGATVRSATVDSETKSIVLNINARTDGSIALTIPKSVLRSDSTTGDTPFIILVNDDEADFIEIGKDNTSRTVEIFFTEGATQIEIIGTWAVPEFGTIAVIILAVAIISIIAVTARTRLSIFPRY